MLLIVFNFVTYILLTLNNWFCNTYCTFAKKSKYKLKFISIIIAFDDFPELEKHLQIILWTLANGENY